MFTSPVFIGQLTPEGWAQHKQRPFGKLPWRDYWADGAKILRNIQLRLLSRLGVDVERPQRLAMIPNAPQPSSRNPDKGALRHYPKTGQCSAEITKGAARPATIAAPLFQPPSRSRSIGAYPQFSRPPPQLRL